MSVAGEAGHKNARSAYSAGIIRLYAICMLDVAKIGNGRDTAKRRAEKM